jgi:hypothetical protein
MFKIKWTPEAETLYFETLEYWINHNKSNNYSLKIIAEVERKEKLLSAKSSGFRKLFYLLQDKRNNC